MFNFLFIFVLILLNGVFAAAEMAFVAARNARLQTFADEGSGSAVMVIEEKNDPGRFLAMVQVGITLVATFASALGGLEAAQLIAPAISQIPPLAPYASQIALGIVVIAITFLSLVFGELVPKQLALRDPARFIMRIIRPLRFLTRLLRLPIRLLDFTTKLVLRLFGGADTPAPSTTEQEIAVLADEAASEGNIEAREGVMIRKVFAYTDTRIADVMTAKPHIVSLDASDTFGDALKTMQESGYSRYPVYGDDEELVGYIHFKDLIGLQSADSIRPYIREFLLLPATMRLPAAFTMMQRSEIHLAVVVDEFGGIIGVVSLEDMIEELLGEIEDEYDDAEEPTKQRGSWEIDGATSLLDVNQMLGAGFATSSHYTTLAGFFLEQWGSLPVVGDEISADNYTLTVLEIDGNRIAQIRIASE